MGRPTPMPGEPLFLTEDTDAIIALAEEERDTCSACGMPKAWCRDQEKARARWGITEHFCWATFRLAQRKPKLDEKGNVSAVERATLVSPSVKEGYEPDMLAGLDIHESEQADD